MIMSKKLLIILSVVGVIVVAAVVVLILQLVNGKTTTQQLSDGSPKPGESVALADTPDFKACSTVSIDALKASLGNDGSSLSEGQRQGIIGHNLQKADSCTYPFITGGINSMLRIEVYPYAASDATSDSNTFDSTWRNITSAQYPEYTTPYPAYYKERTQAESTQFVLQIVTGARHYHFAISQPEGKATYDDEAALKVLIALAVKADYTLANDPNAPPAPVTSDEQTPPKLEGLTPPPVTDENYKEGPVETVKPGEPTI